MNYRFMRLIVFFDLPMLTDIQRNDYTAFRKYLLRSGFIMMQKSVYTKLVINGTVSEAVKSGVRKHLPQSGLVEMLEVTERQFSNVEYLSGVSQTKVVDSDKRLIRL